MRKYVFDDEQPNFKDFKPGDTMLLSKLICIDISADEFEPEGSYFGKAHPDPSERFVFEVIVSWVQNFTSNQLTVHGHMVENKQPYGVEVIVSGDKALIKVFHQPLPLKY